MIDTPVSAIDKTIEVNIRGYMIMTQLAARMMQEGGGGSIINTASVNALNPAIGKESTQATKAAVVSKDKTFCDGTYPLTTFV
jgi:NAD(P)-dependent dehydrogenase (short-subunit alcohol dehydrogenase family)